jgi:hypothetical protein
MTSKLGTGNIMWTSELYTDDREAISLHMGYTIFKKTGQISPTAMP